MNTKPVSGQYSISSPFVKNLQIDPEQSLPSRGAPSTVVARDTLASRKMLESKTPSKRSRETGGDEITLNKSKSKSNVDILTELRGQELKVNINIPEKRHQI